MSANTTTPIDKLTDEQLLDLVKATAPGAYTERDGGTWYVIAPGHSERYGEDFTTRRDARLFLAWLSLPGIQLPSGWELGDKSRLAIDINISGKGRATIWCRASQRDFPGRW